MAQEQSAEAVLILITGFNRDQAIPLVFECIHVSLWHHRNRGMIQDNIYILEQRRKLAAAFATLNDIALPP